MIVDNNEEVITGDENRKTCSSACDVVEDMCSSDCHDTCGDGLPSVKKNPINQRFLRCGKKNRCVFLFPRRDDITGDLPKGIGF